MSVVGFTCFIGTLYLFYVTLKILRYIFYVVKAAVLGRSKDFKRFGAWAVVTGCTDGIGKSYAKQLAENGLNIVLMSRSKEKLDVTSSEIEKECQVQTKIIQVDFSEGHEIYDHITKELAGLEIGVLVNNVGCAMPYPSYFGEASLELTWKQINVNILSTTMMTRLIIPAMAERRKGVIINVASFSADIPMPLASEYSATKSYVDKFSANLQYEYENKGIIIQCVKPLRIMTNMSRIKTSSLFIPSPDDYVRAVLQKVGVTRKCYGYWPHELQAFMATLPEWLVVKIVVQELENSRTRALEEKKQKIS